MMTLEERRIYQRNWVENNRERWRERKRESYARHRERYQLEKTADYHLKKEQLNPERRPRGRLRSRLVRLALTLYIGRRCVRCGYDKDVRGLALHHINSNGGIERKKFNGSITLYNYYLQHLDEAKRQFVVLCATCNVIMKYENHEHIIEEDRVPKELLADLQNNPETLADLIRSLVHNSLRWKHKDPKCKTCVEEKRFGA